ncbi:hypothetical protein SAMN04488058_101263 [Deinococcus reticulitermitis]|uniref:TolC family protein n=1 Tax=Deinococcus reticulitermitis TaxID=856736 RepID=A0A1H6SCL7_9DEIO|nr:hypothetical protein [Deinococcus reticulitermitis]SEI65888.1 hypothetical protein SAMN04488058_101263 [Deinococcus reticulitermitis]
MSGEARQEGGAVPSPLPALSADALRAASAEVIRATAELERSARVLAEVRFELDTQEAERIAAGIEGKNESERKANLRLQLSEKYAELSGAEIGAAGARADLDIAKVRLDCLRFQLRLLEVQAGGRA